VSRISHKDDLTLDAQLKKFAIKSFRGFNSVLVFGLGRRLGIFDYLANQKEKGKKVDGSTIISFNFDDIVKDLNLDPSYFDGWLHMTMESGIFELEKSCERCFKTAPFIFEIMIDRNSGFYIGNLIAWIYYNALFQDEIYKRFHSGKTLTLGDLPPEWTDDFQKMAGQQGTSLERIFAANFKDYKKKLRKEGKILEIGCGFGYHIKGWANLYKNVKIVGIDIDQTVVNYAKELVEKNQLSNRVKIIKTSVGDFAKNHPNEYDIILMNQVLHEIQGDDSNRKLVIDNLYFMLKNGGKLLIGESMIPSIFTPKQNFLFYEIVHKWFEILFGSRFYDEEQFRKFISTTSFTKVNIFRRGTDYLWVLEK